MNSETTERSVPRPEFMPATTDGLAKKSMIAVTQEDITKFLCPKANEKEVFMALGIIKSLNLNPFNREVHLIKYDDKSAIKIVVGYEVYIKRAERTKQLNGWKAWIDKQAGTANIIIHRKDWDNPFEWSIKLDEFNKKQSTWNEIPDFMGKKVVIAQGFRLAFPDELGGMPYTQEEYDVYDITSDSVAESPAVPAMPARKSEAAAPAPTQAKNPEPVSEPKPKDTYPDALKVRIKIKNVGVYNGTGKKGAYTIYNVYAHDGSKYSTFDSGLAKTLDVEGMEFDIEYTLGSYGNSLVKASPVGDAQADMQGDAQE